MSGAADAYVTGLAVAFLLGLVLRIAIALGEANWRDLFMPWCSDDQPSNPANRIPYRRPTDVD